MGQFGDLLSGQGAAFRAQPLCIPVPGGRNVNPARKKNEAGNNLAILGPEKGGP